MSGNRKPSAVGNAQGKDAAPAQKVAAASGKRETEILSGLPNLPEMPAFPSLTTGAETTKKTADANSSFGLPNLPDLPSFDFILSQQKRNDADDSATAKAKKSENAEKVITENNSNAILPPPPVFGQTTASDSNAMLPPPVGTIMPPVAPPNRPPPPPPSSKPVGNPIKSLPPPPPVVQPDVNIPILLPPPSVTSSLPPPPPPVAQSNSNISIILPPPSQQQRSMTNLPPPMHGSSLPPPPPPPPPVQQAIGDGIQFNNREAMIIPPVNKPKPPQTSGPKTNSKPQPKPEEEHVSSPNSTLINDYPAFSFDMSTVVDAYDFPSKFTEINLFNEMMHNQGVKTIEQFCGKNNDIDDEVCLASLSSFLTGFINVVDQNAKSFVKLIDTKIQDISEVNSKLGQFQVGMNKIASDAMHSAIDDWKSDFPEIEEPTPLPSGPKKQPSIYVFPSDSPLNIMTLEKFGMLNDNTDSSTLILRNVERKEHMTSPSDFFLQPIAYTSNNDPFATTEIRLAQHTYCPEFFQGMGTQEVASLNSQYGKGKGLTRTKTASSATFSPVANPNNQSLLMDSVIVQKTSQIAPTAESTLPTLLASSIPPFAPNALPSVSPSGVTPLSVDEVLKELGPGFSCIPHPVRANKMPSPTKGQINNQIPIISVTFDEEESEFLPPSKTNLPPLPTTVPISQPLSSDSLPPPTTPPPPLSGNI